MSTTNNQSIQQINTAAPSAAPREAHQPDEIKPTTKEISMNTAIARPRRKKQKTGEPAQPVHDLKAAARYLASYIRAHAMPLNKYVER